MQSITNVVHTVIKDANTAWVLVTAVIGAVTGVVSFVMHLIKKT